MNFRANNAPARLVVLTFAFFPVNGRPALKTLNPAEISSFTRYTHYASATYCSPDKTITWSCGSDCSSNANFQPVASGGDGFTVQYWFVGYDPNLRSVIVGYEGTDPLKLLPLLTDLEVALVTLDPKLFPAIPSSVRVHQGFSQEHARSAPAVLTAVKATLAQFSSKHVTLIGHSLGAALALLESLHLQAYLPDAISVAVIGYGMPRVGNKAFADFVDSNIRNLTRINNRSALVTHSLRPLMIIKSEDAIPVLPPRLPHGYQHPSGEIHIQVDGNWVVCPGQENGDSHCSAGSVNPFTVIGGVISSILEGNIRGYHNGPYGTVSMVGC